MSANGLRLIRLNLSAWLKHRKIMLASGNSYADSNSYSCVVSQIKSSMKHFLWLILYLNHK